MHGLEHRNKYVMLPYALSHRLSVGLPTILTRACSAFLHNHHHRFSCLDSLITGSWDASIRQWDPRSPEALKCTSPQPSKIFSMSLSGNMLVVAMAGRHVF